MKKERIAVGISQTLAERIRNACYWTPGLTLTLFAERAFTAYVEQLENEHGGSFKSRAGELKKGPPLKS
ncbi:hypothetical protein ACFL27_09430 [candidate division CSSED10-310 bacterium]|uniref:CopG family transcriptional regulator n=1 Tax=candidate division CSSED10-310 bacterium TaxID=2855610 RepID=A0ABV6YW58_UNCC1